MMDIERVNRVLSTAIVALQESEIDGLFAGLQEGTSALAPVIREMTKKIWGGPASLGKWQYSKDWEQYTKWRLIPKKNGLLLRVDKLDKNKKPKEGTKLFVPIRATDDGKYEVDTGKWAKISNSPAEAANEVWRRWDDYVSD